MRTKISKPPAGPRAILFDLKRRVQKYVTVRKLRHTKTSTFPSLIDFEVTNHCNLSCIMCARASMKRPKGFMDMDLFKKIVDQIPPHRIEKSWFHLHGEPLLHPKLTDMIRYARETADISELGISTNCIPLNKAKSSALLTSPLDTFVLSIDGATSETYEKIRLNGDFDKVVENATRFIKMRDEKGLNRPAVWIQIVEMQDNAAEIEKFNAHWAPLLGPQDQVFVKNFSSFGGKIDDRSDYYHRMPRTRPPCSFLWSYFVIYWDGRVTPCCMDVNADLCIGDLKTSSIEEIWASPRLTEFREIHLRGAFDEMPMCADCWGH